MVPSQGQCVWCLSRSCSPAIRTISAYATNTVILWPSLVTFHPVHFYRPPTSFACPIVTACDVFGEILSVGVQCLCCIFCFHLHERSSSYCKFCSLFPLHCRFNYASSVQNIPVAEQVSLDHLTLPELSTSDPSGDPSSPLSSGPVTPVDLPPFAALLNALVARKYLVVIQARDGD